MLVFAFVGSYAAIKGSLEELRREMRPARGHSCQADLVAADRSAGKVVVAIRFDSEEDLRKGSATLDAMSPPEVGTIRRVSVDAYEVVLEQEAP